MRTRHAQQIRLGIQRARDSAESYTAAMRDDDSSLGDGWIAIIWQMGREQRSLVIKAFDRESRNLTRKGYWVV